MRKGIVVQMTPALQVLHAYVQMEVDVDELVALPRNASEADFQKREGCSLSYVPFVVKASAEALRLNRFTADLDLRRAAAKRLSTSGSPSPWTNGPIVP